QAEDGIRERNVTGVKTCALPILENINSIKATASTIFAQLRYRIPLSTPVVAESINNTVTIAMTIKLVVKVSGIPSNVKLNPDVICFAPSPSEVAIPKTVANTANVSIAPPQAPLDLSPINGAKAELIKAGA